MTVPASGAFDAEALAVLVAFAFTLPPGRLAAQTAEDSAGVRRALADYVEGFYEGDSTKHVRSVRPDVFTYGFWLPRDSTRYQGEAMPFSEFLDYTRRMRARGAKAAQRNWRRPTRIGPGLPCIDPVSRA